MCRWDIKQWSNKRKFRILKTYRIHSVISQHQPFAFLCALCVFLCVCVDWIEDSMWKKCIKKNKFANESDANVNSQHFYKSGMRFVYTYDSVASSFSCHTMYILIWMIRISVFFLNFFFFNFIECASSSDLKPKPEKKTKYFGNVDERVTQKYHMGYRWIGR